MKVSDKRFSGAILRILRPFARLLIRCGVSYPEFDALARAAFVETATSDYGKRGRPANVSRVASIVGLSRKEVTRIRDVGMTGAWYPETHMSPSHRIFHYWQHDKDFSPSPAIPGKLPLAGEKSFATLVKRYAGDLPAGAIRSELEARGAMVVNADGQCTLRLNFLRFSEDQEDLINWILFSLRNLMETVEFNSREIGDESDQEPGELRPNRFERSVWTNRLSPDDSRAFHEWLEHNGQAFLESANAFITERESSNREPLSGEGAVGVGMYFYQQEHVEE